MFYWVLLLSLVFVIACILCILCSCVLRLNMFCLDEEIKHGEYILLMSIFYSESPMLGRDFSIYLSN